MTDVSERRVALVTSGAQRDVRAIIGKLAAEGFHIVFTSHSSEAEADTMAARVNAQAINAELTDAAAATQQIHATFDAERLDVLVNSTSSTWSTSSPCDRGHSTWG